MDIKYKAKRYCQQLRSKSHEHLKLNRSDIMQEEVLEWWQMHKDKVKINKWEEKLQRLAEKMKRPGGEEKLRMKIMKCLKRVPSQLSECNDERKEFRERLPDNIIRRLKKDYLNNEEKPSPVKVFRLELPKCYHKRYSNRHKIIIRSWLKTLPIRKKDFLGRLIKRNDILDYILHKISPLLISKPDSKMEYKYIFKSYLMDIVQELPILTGSSNKIHYLNKITDKLIDNLLSDDDPCNYKYNNKYVALDCQSDFTSVKPWKEFIKEFVAGEITNIVDRSHICISTKRMTSIETALTDILMDAMDYLTINMDENIKDIISFVLQDIGKLNNLQAKQLSNSLFENFKGFYHNIQKYTRKKELKKCLTNSTDIKTFTVFHNAMNHNIYENKDYVGLDQYEKQLLKEIDMWLENTQIPLAKEKDFRDIAVKDLADQIVSSCKNVSTKTKIISQECLNYLIFKWINNLAGKSNVRTANWAQELVRRIQNIPSFIENCNESKLHLPSCHDYHVSSGFLNESKSYVDQVTNEILDWSYDLPYDLYSSEDAGLNDQLIKELAHNIDNGIKAKRNIDDVMNKEVDSWFNNFIKGKARNSFVQELKMRLKNIYINEEYIDRDSKRKHLTQYEDLIDEWFDTFFVEPRYTATYINTKNELIHELAVKLHNIKSKLAQSSAEAVETKMREDISIWLKKIPLHPYADKKYYRDRLAKLITKIQNINLKDSMKEVKQTQRDQGFDERLLESVLTKWLKTSPLYQNKDANDRDKQAAIIKELANKLSQAQQSNIEINLDKEIRHYVKILLPQQDFNEEFAQHTVNKIKTSLQKLNILQKVSKGGGNINKKIVTIVEVWLSNLPLNVNSDKEQNIIDCLRKEFILKIKEIQNKVHRDQFLKEEIHKLIIALPMDSSTKCDKQFLNTETKNFIQTLKAVLVTDGCWKSQPKSVALIYDAAVDWSKTLPLNLVHCPMELNSLIGQMTTKIYKLIVQPEHSKPDNNKERIKSEILKYLRAFPLRDDRQSEHYLYEMVDNFWDVLRYRYLYRNDENDFYNNTHKIATSNSNTICTAENILNQDIDYFNTTDYFNQLTHQIDEWLSDLHILQVKEKSYRQIAVNDLAQDIIDRHQYVEINPSSRSAIEAELEHLKYLIFKRINKLVGEENLETIAHAPELMQKIQSMPVSIFTDVNKNITNEYDKTQVPMFKLAEAERRLDYILKLRTSIRHVQGGKGNKVTTVNPNEVKQMFSPEDPDGNLTDSHSQVHRRLNNPLEFQLSPMACKNIKIAMPILAQVESGHGGPRGQPRQTIEQKYSNGPYNPFEESRVASRVSDAAEFTELEEGTTVSQIYEQYTIILKIRCDEIPLATPTPEQESFVKMTRQTLFNCIWKTFFKLKSDPEIENDYLCFEFLLEDRLDEMYDCLPETADVQKIRETWKAKVVLDVMRMLKKIHCITDSSSFRRQVADKIERYIIRNNKQIWADDYHNYIVLSTADQYVAYKKYQESDPVKANIYKQRLMKHIEEMVCGYDLIKMPTKKLTELQQQCFLGLEAVPVPGEDMLEEEVDEIMIGEEIEKWFNELPLYRLEGEELILMRERLRQLLAKKIHEWEKRFNLDEPSIERNMKHDMSVFLGRRGILQEDVDLNINLMVDELADRLRARRQQKDLLGYQSFERKKPLSSSLVPLNPNPVLPQLIAAENERHPDKVASSRQTLGPIAIAERSQAIPERVHNDQPALVASQTTGHVVSSPESREPNIINNHAGPSSQEAISYQRPCWPGKLGTSQVAGPSHATKPLSALIQGQPGPYKQASAQLPSDNSIWNVQDVGPSSVQAATVEPSVNPQCLPNHETTQGQGTRSTARVMETGEPQFQGQRDVVYTEEERAEERYHCRCVDGVCCRKRRYVCGCDGDCDDDDSRYINVPCRYNY